MSTDYCYKVAETALAQFAHFTAGSNCSPEKKGPRVVAAKRTRVVFVHGWAGSAESWRPVLELLDPRVWDARAVRLPGSPTASTTTTTVDAAATELVDLLRLWPQPALLVGHSMGAQVTMLAHGRAPSAVRGEVVIDPAYGAAGSEKPRMAAWADRIDREGHQAVAAFFESATPGMPAGVAHRLINDLYNTSATTIARYLRSEYVDTEAIGLLPATVAAAARRVRPVLSLHSTAESATREAALPSPPGSSSRTWSGHGHFLHLEDPQRFVTDLTGWLSTVPIPGAANSLASAPVG